ncbi:MAG: hypothetical protein VYA55_03695 [Pseudomonadota bacterium]|nr:hypothetical protein [Pseudomonadota bacterium]
MKLKTVFSASLLSLAIAGASSAMAEVSVTSFSAGQAATAASVNANFTAVANGVNTNEAAIAALLARIEALEAEHETTTYQERITGSTYKLSWTYHAYFGADKGDGSMTDYVRFLMGGGGSTIIFNGDGTITELAAAESEAEGSTFLYDEDPMNDPGGVQTNNMDSSTDSWEDTSGTSTWSVNESTGIVTIVWEGEEEDSFQSSEDGSLFVRLGSINEVNDDNQRVVENHSVHFVRVPSLP